jgi:hypothetical protein
MKGYVGTVLEIPESVIMAARCVKTGEQFGVDVEMVPAVYRDEALVRLGEEQLKLAKFDDTYSNVGAVVGNFITQFYCWHKVLKSDEPGIVLEHDAVFTAAIPDLEGKGDIINLGKPSYGNYRSASPGVHPMFSKPGGYIPGAHGYYITVEGALRLITKAKQIGATPCDLFLNKTNFPDIKELFPWIIEARDEFTTIQKVKGCIAKHNYDDQFEIL